MTKTRMFVAVGMLAAAIALGGCSAIRPDVGAVNAARLATKSVVVAMPDARLVSVATPAETDLAEPESWSVVFYSAAAGRVVLVPVAKGKAAEPQVLTRTSVAFPKGDPADADRISVDSDEALRLAEAALAKTGVKLPKYVLMNLEFASIDGAKGAPGEWVVGFLDEPGAVPVRTIGVDSTSGKTRDLK